MRNPADSHRSNTPQSRQLHNHIVGYCSANYTPREAKRGLFTLKQYLGSQKENPAFILDIPDSHHCSHLMDALHLPFDPNKSGKARVEKALNLFNALTYFIHEAIGAGKITKEDYAKLLTLPTRDGFSLLHQAVKNGDLGLACMVFKEIKENVPDEEFIYFTPLQAWIT